MFKFFILILLSLSLLSFSSAQGASKYGVKEGIKRAGILRKIEQGNNDEAIEELKYFAEKDDEKMLCVLAHLYLKKNDVEQAMHWFEKSARQGYGESQFQLGMLYSDNYILYSNKIKVNHEKARFWLEHAADQNHLLAQFSLGKMYYDGCGEAIPQNFLKAAYWFKKSALQGCAESQFYLGMMFFFGDGVRQDQEHAFYWFEKGAKQKHNPSACNLALCYLEGIGTKKNPAKAKEWLEKSAKNGNLLAPIVLEKLKRRNGVSEPEKPSS